MSDEHDERVEDDILSIEDGDVQEDLSPSDQVPNVDETAVDLNMPQYRLRFSYSKETIIGAWGGSELSVGDVVVTPTRYGLDLATVIGVISPPYPSHDPAKIVRPASDGDLARQEMNNRKEHEAFSVAKQKIDAHRLDMKLVLVHYLLEEPKILFFFTAENRVDFRELVKDLVGIFKTRIELRQIGVRDESRIVGGLGVCGRGYCCHTISDKLRPVSIKMAKDQNLSLNSMKISGPCGRLLCCLSYEHGHYQEERRSLPPEGCRLHYDGVQCKVIEVNPITGRVRLSGEDGRILDLPKTKFERVEGRWRYRAGDDAE